MPSRNWPRWKRQHDNDSSPERSQARRVTDLIVLVEEVAFGRIDLTLCDLVTEQFSRE